MALRKQKVVAVSGGFDPIHIGHLDLFERAKKIGDKLVVILNNDNWIRLKRRRIAFMPHKDRKRIIEAFSCVDRVVLTRHSRSTKDLSINETLRRVKPDIFANGGDRTKKNIPELVVCKEIGARTVFGIGKKIRSSSWFLKEYIDAQGKKR